MSEPTPIATALKPFEVRVFLFKFSILQIQGSFPFQLNISWIISDMWVLSMSSCVIQQTFCHPLCTLSLRE